jgi:hypothetical protein
LPEELSRNGPDFAPKGSLVLQEHKPAYGTLDEDARELFDRRQACRDLRETVVPE